MDWSIIIPVIIGYLVGYFVRGRQRNERRDADHVFPDHGRQLRDLDRRLTAAELRIESMEGRQR